MGKINERCGRYHRRWLRCCSQQLCASCEAGPEFVSGCANRGTSCEDADHPQAPADSRRARRRTPSSTVARHRRQARSRKKTSAHRGGQDRNGALAIKNCANLRRQHLSRSNLHTSASFSIRRTMVATRLCILFAMGVANDCDLLNGSKTCQRK